eukprot:4984913-Pleurochrysis_carterae.AAC.2
MPAWPQPGDREKYWGEPRGGFGPRHRSAERLKLGSKQGAFAKNKKWFLKMHACFRLPECPAPAGNSQAPPDPFKLVPRFLDALRNAFHKAGVCSWLVVLDESMVRWEGRGMPGLMV